MPRYHYERYQATEGNSWDCRVQWLVFDRKSIGCMCSLGTEIDAAQIVTALNALDKAQPDFRNEWRAERVSA